MIRRFAHTVNTMVSIGVCERKHVRGSCSSLPRLPVEGHVQVLGCGRAWYSMKYSTCFLVSSPVAHTETTRQNLLKLQACIVLIKSVLRPRLVAM